MSNNLRIFKKELDTNTTEKKIKVLHHYICDGVSHFIQTSLEVTDDFDKLILTHWGRRMQLGCCNKICGSLNLGYIPKIAEMRFSSISIIDNSYNKKDP